MNKIKVGPGHVAFDTAGTGPALLLLHAFPLSSAMWTPQLERFGRQHRVIRVDARGFGESDLWPDPLSMDRIAEDAAAVLDHLGVNRAVVCGCSMGGYAALAFARHFASRLRGLVLVDTRAAADTDEARAGRHTLAQKVLAQGAAVVADAMLPKILGATSHRDRSQLVDRVRQWMLAARLQAIASALHGLGARPDSRPTLSNIQVPTLIVRGEEDVIASAPDAEEMQRGITGSRVVTIPAAGHLPSLETPEAFNEAVLTFLGSLP
jgi:3-oxoadipate enol-lactonase